MPPQMPGDMPETFRLLILPADGLEAEPGNREKCIVTNAVNRLVYDGKLPEGLTVKFEDSQLELHLPGVGWWYPRIPALQEIADSFDEDGQVLSAYILVDVRSAYFRPAPPPRVRKPRKPIKRSWGIFLSDSTFEQAEMNKEYEEEFYGTVEERDIRYPDFNFRTPQTPDTRRKTKYLEHLRRRRNNGIADDEK